MTFVMNAPESVLARLFPDTATIQSPTNTQDPDEGQVDQTWTDLFTDVQSQFAPLGGSESTRDTERRTEAGDFVRGSHQAILRGDYEVTEAHRCLTRGRIYGVVGVNRDSYGIATTLHLEDLSPDSQEESS